MTIAQRTPDLTIRIDTTWDDVSASKSTISRMAVKSPHTAVCFQDQPRLPATRAQAPNGRARVADRKVETRS